MVLVWSMECSNLCDARAAGNAGRTVPRKYRFSFNPLVPPFSLILSLFLFFSDVFSTQVICSIENGWKNYFADSIDFVLI
jgi:hypothetical protein